LNSKRQGLHGGCVCRENVRWNKLLVLQLLRAGKGQLRDAGTRRLDAPTTALLLQPEGWPN
jgi:hypothetical protein